MDIQEQKAKIKKNGGARPGSGRKPGINKIQKTFKIDKNIFEKFKDICDDLKIIQKLEEAMINYIENIEKNKMDMLKKFSKSDNKYLLIVTKYFNYKIYKSLNGYEIVKEADIEQDRFLVSSIEELNNLIKEKINDYKLINI